MLRKEISPQESYIGPRVLLEKNETKRRGKTTGNLNLRVPIPLTTTSVTFVFLTNIVSAASYRKRCA